MSTKKKNQSNKIVPGATSKALGPNPKDLFGVKKVSISKLPAVGMIQGAMAFMDGAAKYGPYNWRDRKVIASIYVDSMYRHIMDWFEGQECAQDSKVHHLGHVIACAALLLDAQTTGNMIDDRPIQRDKAGNPIDANWLADFLGKMSEDIKARTMEQQEKMEDAKK